MSNKQTIDEEVKKLLKPQKRFFVGWRNFKCEICLKENVAIDKLGRCEDCFNENRQRKPLPRMLFLDDRTKRIEAARKKYTHLYDVTYVHNVKECLRYLCRQEFDIVSLDHDLDGDDFQNPDDVTSGMEVVRYIVKCGGFPPSQIVKPEVWIHSSNLLAANLMISELLKVGIHAYFRKFEYEDEITFSNAKVSREPVVVEDKWEHDSYGACISCDNRLKMLDKNSQCHDCYKREMKQCA